MYQIWLYLSAGKAAKLIIYFHLWWLVWLPYRVFVVYNSFAKNTYKDQWFLLFCRLMVCMNSSINPILTMPCREIQDSIQKIIVLWWVTCLDLSRRINNISWAVFTCAIQPMRDQCIDNYSYIHLLYSIS